MLQDECYVYRQALEDIADPLAALRREAEEQGCGLHGCIAVSLSNDPVYLKKIAQDALDQFKLGSLRHT